MVGRFAGLPLLHRPGPCCPFTVRPIKRPKVRFRHIGPFVIATDQIFAHQEIDVVIRDAEVNPLSSGRSSPLEKRANLAKTAQYFCCHRGFPPKVTKRSFCNRLTKVSQVTYASSGMHYLAILGRLSVFVNPAETSLEHKGYFFRTQPSLRGAR